MLETGAGLLSWDGTYMMNVMEPLEFVIVSVLAFNLLGDGLRAVLPSLRRRKAKAGSPVSSRVTKPSTSVGQSPKVHAVFGDSLDLVGVLPKNRR